MDRPVCPGTGRACLFLMPAALGILTLVSLSLPVPAGPPETAFHYAWVIPVAGAEEQQVNGVAVDAQGGVHMAGQSRGATLVGSGAGSITLTNAGDWDFFVASLSHQGELLWARGGGGAQADMALGVAADTGGATLVAGYFRPGASWAGQPMAGVARDDGFVSKIDTSGAVLWTRLLTGPGDERLTAVSADPQGNVYVAGYFQSGARLGDMPLTHVGGVDLLVAKLDPEGVPLWVRPCGGSSLDVGLAVSADVSGAAVGGYFGGNAAFGPAALQSTGNVDLVTMRLRSDGSVAWARGAGGALDDYAHTVALDPDGGLLVSGSIKGDARFGDVLLAGTGQRSFLAGHGAEGSLRFARGLGATEIRGLARDGEGFWMAGQFLGTAAMDSLSVTSRGNLDIVLGRLDGSGAMEWVKPLGGPGQDNAFCIAPDGGGGCVVGGRFSDTVDFGGLSTQSAGVGDGFVARLSPAPMLTRLPAGQTVFPESRVVLGAGAVGAPPLEYQWFFNDSVPLPGQTFSELVIEEVSLLDKGLYTVVVRNAHGSATSPPVNLNVFGIARPRVRLDGAAGASFDLTNRLSALVSLSHSLPGVSMYYTLDGTAPTFASSPYTGTFTLSTSSTLRAVAYDPAFSASETAPVPVTFHVGPPRVSIDGVEGREFAFTNRVRADVELRSPMPGTEIRYTLDGSLPSSTGSLYSAAIVCTQSVVLRALALRAGMLAGDTGPVPVRLERVYTLSVTPSPDGTVALSPPGGIYAGGTEVQLQAQVRPGWNFLGWTGDVSGLLARTVVVMDRNRTATPLFGTPVQTSVFGSGSVRLKPLLSSYVRGTRVEVTAVPEDGFFLSVWGGVGSGAANPLVFSIDGPVPTLSALFSRLGPGSFSVTALADEGGGASVDPARPFHASGTTVTLTATPPPGLLFDRWSGTRTSLENPWSFAVDTNVVVTASFRADDRPRISAFQPLPPASNSALRELSFRIEGPTGQVYRLEISTNLLRWDESSAHSSVRSPGPIRLPIPTVSPAFFRLRYP